MSVLCFRGPVVLSQAVGLDRHINEQVQHRVKKHSKYHVQQSTKEEVTDL